MATIETETVTRPVGITLTNLEWQAIEGLLNHIGESTREERAANPDAILPAWERARVVRGAVSSAQRAAGVGRV